MGKITYKKKRKTEYVLYKGDKFVSVGTIKEIAKETGQKESTVKFYASPAYQKRVPGGNGYILIKIEEDEE